MNEKVHVLKLNEMFINDVLYGGKRVEVREDDRLFQRGDYLKFKAVNCGGLYVRCEDLESKKYIITYVEHGYGIEPGYCAFSFEEVDQ